MKGLNFFVLEDDPIFRSGLVKDIKSLGHDVLVEVSNLTDAQVAIGKHVFDFFLLDITMDDSTLDGFSFANLVVNQNKPIIFSTNMNSTKIYQKVKEFPFGFLLIKPYDKMTLQSAIDSLVEKVYKSSKLPSNLIGNEDHIFVSTNNKFYKVFFNEIYNIRALGNYCYLQTDKQCLVVQKSLKKIKELLPANKFLRIHRNYIINVNHISMIDMSSKIININGQDIPLGNHYKKSLLLKLKTL